MGHQRWAVVSVLLLLLSSSSVRSEKVRVSVYYETLCPFCANFVVNHLVKLFENGLIAVVDLRLIPWGNAWIQPDGAFICQHGPDECMLNTIEACTISIYPDTERHFRFIHCVEGLTLQNRHNEWTKCFDIAKLSAAPIEDCYRNGHGKLSFASETLQLNPPRRFVPWVVVNNQPLQEDYKNFMAYICKAYTGNPAPAACRAILVGDRHYRENADGGDQVCYAVFKQNSTSLPAAKSRQIQPEN